MNVSNVCSGSNPYQSPSTDGFSQLYQDFTGIGGAIQSGDLSTAQNSLTAFQTDLQNNSGTNPLSNLFANNSTLNADLTSLQTALKSNDPAAAQTAFKGLVSDMQGAMKAQQTQRGHGHHHHHHASNDQTSATTAAAASTNYATGTTTGVPTTGNLLNTQA